MIVCFVRCLIIWMIIGILITCLVSTSLGISAHSHLTQGEKERVSDGPPNPRDANHYKDGEHHSEYDHEVILGSRETAEEYDHLSPEEAKKRLKGLASKMDANQDGFVDETELVDWILHSFQMLSEEESLEKLEDVDSNDDGKVTWEEYASETFDSYDDDNEYPLQPDQFAAEQAMMAEDELMFKAADVNQDEVLDPNEFRAFTHPEEHEHMLPILLQRTLEDKDLDKDSLISFEEFLGKPRDRESEMYEKDRFDNDFDLDGDGKLNKEEVILWLVPNNTEIAINEAEHLIENSDVNMDGFLSIDEIVDHHDVFVGSEATDFGNHLHHFGDEL